MVRVLALFDGFNFYHAVDGLGLHHLKWVDLLALARVFAPSPRHEVVAAMYFSAYATWLPVPYRRHRAYVEALRAIGVVPVLGQFKSKAARCKTCGAAWTAHEEKETDVNIALALVEGALDDEYDRALLFTADSDLAPAVTTVRRRWPAKDIRIMIPLKHAPSYELIQAAGGRGRGGRALEVHLERCLLPADVTNASGAVVARCPVKYDPPGSTAAPNATPSA